MTLDDPNSAEIRARQEALALLSRTQGMRMEVEQARSSASSSGRAQLSKIMANLSGAEVRLAQAVETSTSGQPIDLSGIEALLGSTEQEANAAVQESAADAAATKAQSAAAVYAATRGEVQSISHDLFEQKVFDPYLHFGSAEDEAAYREREAARQKAIAQHLATHTLAGDYQASLVEKQQLDDAGAHGATKSPQYQSMRNRLDQVLETQKQAIAAQVAHDQEPGSATKASAPSDAAPSAPVVTVKPQDMGVDLAALGISADPATQGTGHGLPDQTRTSSGKSTGRG